MDTPRIRSIQIGKPKTYRHDSFPDEKEREWTSGIFKEPVYSKIFVGRLNLEGDGQADLEFHGGADRAVLCFAHSNLPVWERELGRALPPGAFGENFTVEGLTEDTVCLGDQWEIGEVLLEVSQPRLPCSKLARRLDSPGLNAKVMRAMTGGWYCRVLREGYVQPGEMMNLVNRSCPDWTIRRAFREYIFGENNIAQLQELRQVPALSELWKTGISAKLEKLPG